MADDVRRTVSEQRLSQGPPEYQCVLPSRREATELGESPGRIMGQISPKVVDLILNVTALTDSAKRRTLCERGAWTVRCPLLFHHPRRCSMYGPSTPENARDGISRLGKRYVPRISLNTYRDNDTVAAGIPIEKCSGSDTSVYTGCFTSDYMSILQQDYEADQRHAVVGAAVSMLANRLSWFFNFKGTSANLDSACSSSLVALHLACQDLTSRSSSMVHISFG